MHVKSATVRHAHDKKVGWNCKIARPLPFAAMTLEGWRNYVNRKATKWKQCTAMSREDISQAAWATLVAYEHIQSYTQEKIKAEDMIKFVRDVRNKIEYKARMAMLYYEWKSDNFVLFQGDDRKASAFTYANLMLNDIASAVIVGEAMLRMQKANQ